MDFRRIRARSSAFLIPLQTLWWPRAKHARHVVMPGAEAADNSAPNTEADEAERRRLLAAIEAGLADADAGRVRPHAEVVARMRARFSGQAK
jgi:predicted transcriptional regulator